MRNSHSFKNKHATEREIELFCQSIKETLTKIKDRHLKKATSKKSKETTEKEVVTCSQ